MTKDPNAWWERLSEEARRDIHGQLHKFPSPHKELQERFEDAAGAEDDEQMVEEVLIAVGAEKQEQIIEKIEHLVAVSAIWETFKDVFGMTEQQELFLLTSADVEGTLLRELKQVLT